MWHLIQYWLSRQTGSLNTPGTPPNYNFFSGFGSIILPPLLNGLVLAAVFWWHNQCGVTGCYWYARRKTAAGERACFLHHPHKKRTVEEIHTAHHAAKPTRPPKRLARTQEAGTTGKENPGGT